MTVGRLKKLLDGQPDERRIFFCDTHSVDDVHGVRCAVDSVVLNDKKECEEVIILTN